jgi:hypothetical protein
MTREQANEIANELRAQVRVLQGEMRELTQRRNNMRELARTAPPEAPIRSALAMVYEQIKEKAADIRIHRLKLSRHIIANGLDVELLPEMRDVRWALWKVATLATRVQGIMDLPAQDKAALLRQLDHAIEHLDATVRTVERVTGYPWDWRAANEGYGQ